MNLADIIRAAKTDIDVGQWRRGHVLRSQFPMSKLKAKRYKYGPEYKWRVVRFAALSVKCRILILVNEGKAIYRARLGVEQGGDLVILCDHEFHADEPGWHCHLTRDDIESIEPGAARVHTTRWPASPEACSRQEFNVSEINALLEAATRFRFSEREDASQGSLRI